MLILTCILILKYRGGKYRGLSAVLVVAILLLLFFLLRKFCIFIEDRSGNITQEWVNINNFSSTLEMSKKGKIQSYPEITLLSDIDGEVMSINVVTGDIVGEYEVLMQIKNINGISSDYDDVDVMMDVMYENYKKLDKEYNEFIKEYGGEIKELENELYNNQTALVQAIELRDLEGKNILEEEIENINLKLNLLKSQKEYLENGVRNLESEMQLVRNESDKYYYEMDKQTPKSPFDGVVGNIYVNEGESVRNGDKLITIINNNYTPEVTVSLDFNEYLLTKDLTGVYIIIENENRGDYEYNGEIYTRSPILNEEGKYDITIKIISDNISDLILSDENTNINVIFTVISESQWIPDKCFRKIGNNSGVLALRDGELINNKEVEIKNKREGWNNVDNFILYSLEKEEQKDGMELLCDVE